MFYGSGPLRPSQSCIAGSLCPPDLPVAPTQFALAESAATVCFQSCFALFLGLPESTSSLRSGRSPEITSSLKLLPPFGRGAACGLDGLQIAPSLSTGRALKALPRRRSGRFTTGLAQGSTFAPSTPASAIRPGVKTDSQCTYWIVKSHSSGLTRSQNSRAGRSERSPETTSSLRSGRSRGASMGSDSLLQGNFSTTLRATRPSTFQGALKMTSRDWGILRSRIQPVE